MGSLNQRSRSIHSGVAPAANLSSSPRSRPPCVLIVDRDQDNRAIYAEYFRLAGRCEVEEAEDGREALAKALARPYDAIILETRLLGINGYQLCQLLRRDPITHRTPLLMVTGDSQPADIQRACAAGATSVLIKPCLPDVLFAELQKILTEVDRAPANRGALAESPPANRDEAQPSSAPPRTRILSRTHLRGATTEPPLTPPALRCPSCDGPLVYERSHVGGVSARNPEQWDYFECTSRCGTFEYRQRTRKLRRVADDELSRTFGARLIPLSSSS